MVTLHAQLEEQQQHHHHHHKEASKHQESRITTTLNGVVRNRDTHTRACGMKAHSCVSASELVFFFVVVVVLPRIFKLEWGQNGIEKRESIRSIGKWINDCGDGGQQSNGREQVSTKKWEKKNAAAPAIAHFISITIQARDRSVRRSAKRKWARARAREVEKKACACLLACGARVWWWLQNSDNCYHAWGLKVLKKETNKKSSAVSSIRNTNIRCS